MPLFYNEINMSKMRINFLDEISIRNKPPKTFQAFNNHIENYYGLKEINLSTDILEYSYTDTSNQRKIFTNEEEYSELLDVFSNGNLNEVLIDVKEAKPKKENKSKGGFLEHMQSVINEEIDNLKCKLELLLTNENIVKELPNYLTVSKTQCSHCKSTYIIGPVYKCVLCDNDVKLCEKCSVEHKHPMLKIIG